MASGSLWRSAGPLVLGRAVSAVIGIGLPAVLARALDQSSYGTYKQIYLVANLALASLQLGLAQSLFYFVPRAGTDEERRSYIAQTQTMLATLGLLAGLGLWLGTPLIAGRFSNPQLAELAVPLALLAGALIASAPFEIALTSRGKPAWSALALIGTDLVRVAAMLAAVLLGHGVKGLAWAAALSAVARWAACLVVAGGLGRVGFTRETLKRQLVYSLPFGVAVLLQQQQMQLHQIYVAAQATPDLFALYSVGCMNIPIVSLLYTPVSETLQVSLARLERTGETHKAGGIFADAVDKLALVFLPLCTLMMVTAAPTLEILYGAPYRPAASVLRIAVLSVAVASLPVDGVLKARARTGTLLVLYAVKLALTWPLVALGWRAVGMEGAIGAFVAVELLTKFAQLAIIARDLKVSMVSLLGGRKIAQSLVVAALAGGAGALAVRLIPQLGFLQRLSEASAGAVSHAVHRAIPPHTLVLFVTCATAALATAAVVGLELMRRRRLVRVAAAGAGVVKKAA